MQRVIVIAFSTIDGIIEDPDGAEGTPNGGWAFRHGPEAIAGDKFRLGLTFGSGVLLLGSRTWQHFSRIWPARTDEFSAAMNRIPKLVATRTLTDVSAWSNSTVLDEDLVTAVQKLKVDQDVVVAGSASVVRVLAEHDLIDEYRILMFPSVLGTGLRLFPEGSAPVHFRLRSAEVAGPPVLLRYERPTG